MHIAIDARIIASSTGRYVERLITHLEQIDKTNQYSILVWEKDKDYWKPTNKNFTVKIADFDNFSLAEQFGFNKFLKELSPDLVHFCMPQQPVLYKGKTVTTFHDLNLLNTYNSDKNWLMYHFKQLVGRWVFLKVAKRTDHIVVPSEYTKQDIIKTLNADPKKITLTYEAVGSNKTGVSAYKIPFKKYLLYVGQQSDYKNIKKLGQAHQELLKIHPDLGLVLVGSKNLAAQNNEKYFATQNFKNILFTGFIEDKYLNWLFEHAEAYVFPSLMEGFGLPGLEAMAHGAPVVSSNATCLPEVYGKAAVYFDPKDIGDMAEKINSVLMSKKLANELVKNGYKQVKKYSWAKMAKQTHRVYLDVLKTKS